MKPECTDSGNLIHLTSTQASAVDLVLSGQCDTDIAKSLDVHRTTISRWRRFHPGFRAEIDRRRAEVYGSCVERLRGMVPQAIDVLKEGLDSGNFAAATTVLRMAGIDKIPQPQLDPPDGEGIIVALMRNKMRELWNEDQANLTFQERYENARSGPPPEKQRQFAQQALKMVVDELVEKLSGSLADEGSDLDFQEADHESEVEGECLV